MDNKKNRNTWKKKYVITLLAFVTIILMWLQAQKFDISKDIPTFRKLENENIFFIMKQETKEEKKKFKKVLRNIQKHMDTLCRSNINKKYFKSIMKDRITHIWIEYTQKKISTIILGFDMSNKMNKNKTFYIDLFCSIKYLGKNGYQIIELVFSDLLTCKYDLVVLRASHTKLIPYYKRLGFLNVKNACDSKMLSKSFYENINYNNTKDGYWMTKCLRS